MGRITGFSEGASSASFSYDANGNRLSSSQTDGFTTIARTYTVDAAGNRLLGYTQVTTGPSGTSTSPVSYTYNANGELTADGLRSYGFNPESRLSSVTTGSTDTSPPPATRTTRWASASLKQLRCTCRRPRHRRTSGKACWRSLGASGIRR